MFLLKAYPCGEVESMSCNSAASSWIFYELPRGLSQIHTRPAGVLERLLGHSLSGCDSAKHELLHEGA